MHACPHCRLPNPDDAPSCGNCGSALIAPDELRLAADRNATALTLVAEERLDAALAKLSEAIRLVPGYAESYVNRANIFARLELWEKAAADRREASKLAPVTRPAELSMPPWNPSVFWPLAILCGFGAAGVLAGLNYRRLGRPNLTLPTIGVTVAAFLAVIVALSLAELEDTSSWLPFAVNIPPAALLQRLQRSDYERWRERFPFAGGAGWGIPIIVGVASLALAVAVIFAPVLIG